MTRDQLITNIRIKMDADPNDNDNDYYLDSYDSLINECLSVVANTVLPYQNKFEIKWGKYIDGVIDPNDLKVDEYYTFGIDCPELDPEAKRKDWYEYRDGNWQVQKRNNYGYLAKLPKDFLSFSDEASVEYRNSYDELELNVDILYVNSSTIALSKDGNYTIYYNSEYPEVSSGDSTDGETNVDKIPNNVLKIIPTYVASQLLMAEDPIKATQLKNDFETMLARLDANKPLVPYDIRSTGGWV